MDRIFSIVFFLVLTIILSACKNEQGKIEPLTDSWEIAVPHQEIPEGLASLSSEQCGACHQDHYKEWRLSTHAHAWTDLQFQAELKKETSPFMCINCHIPLQNQQEYIVSGKYDGDIYKPVQELNPNFDRELQQEGVNCVACHLRNNTIIGPTGTSLAPHKTVKNPEFLNETLCISCHNAVAVITPTLACSFETGDEWRDGTNYGEQNCINCHMDTITRAIVPGYAKRMSHLHYFSGSGIPKFDSVKTTTLNGLSYQMSAVGLSHNLIDSFLFSFKVKNEFAGHKVPTGDPERFILIKMILTNEDSDSIKTTIFRIGEIWEWYPEAKKIADNNLLPKEERSFVFEYKFAEKDKYLLEIIVEKHRLDKESAHFNELKDNYPLYITIYRQKFEFKVE